MTASKWITSQALSPDIAARKAARRKIIEKAQRLERESNKAMMQRKRQAQTTSDKLF